MTTIITGVAGFIGSNLARRVNNLSDHDVIGIDRMSQDKVKNLRGINLTDFIDYDDDHRIEQLLRSLKPGSLFLHQGACTDTMEFDGRKMMALNFEKSRRWHAICMEQRHRFIYASSAAVYGHGQSFPPGNERPLNIYGFSKLMFDQYVCRQMLLSGPAQTVGLRYFNVYGPGEEHKDGMASCVHRFGLQARSGMINLFEDSDKFKRDFIHVDDVVSVVLHFVQNPKLSGIFNCGSGVSRSFLELAVEVQKHRPCELGYIEMPEKLKANYQKLTCSDNAALRSSGYDQAFISLEKGVAMYMRYLEIESCL